MDFSSFLTSVATSFVIFLVLMLLFVWLSGKPGNSVVYYPNRILRETDPTESLPGSWNPFSWIREAISSTEQEVIRVSGVDTAVYFVFLGTAFGILVFSGMLLLPVLLPVAVTARNSNSGNSTSFKDLDKLSMAHIEEKSSRLWAFVAATYWVSFVAYYLLWKAYDHVSRLRAAALMSPRVRAEQFAVLVRDIPPPSDGQTRKKQVDTYFKMIYPDSYYRSMIVTDNAEVNKVWNELEGYRKKLVRAEAIDVESKKTNPDSPRPMHKTGFLGLVGEKVDSIEFYNEKIKELVPRLESEQKATLREKQQASALVFFSSQVTAAAAAQCLHPRMVDTWTVMDAPEPRQILWPNLSKKFYERQIRQYLVYIFVALTIMFYMIPIAFVSAFTTLDNLRKFLPFLKAVVDIVEIRTVLEAYLPQLALIIFLAMLPKLLLFLSKAEGIPSESHAERAASGKYFYFTIFNVFIGVTIGGTLFDSFKAIKKHPDSLVDLLAKSLPANATFFLTFVALKFFVGYGLELSRIVPLVIFHLKRKYLCKTKAEVREAWAPGDLSYATRIPGDMLIATIVLCYSVIAPIILPFGALYFGIGWLVLRNQALRVYVPSYESYGRMWPHINSRMVASLLLYQVTMFGYFGLKKFYYTPILIPLPVLSLIFAFVCKKKFYRFFEAPALEVARGTQKDAPDMDMDTVFCAFIPPSLSSDKAAADEEQFEDALSHVSRDALSHVSRDASLAK